MTTMITGDGPTLARQLALLPAVAVVIVLLSAPCRAVEVAPRISDREIIEALAELKAGQAALNQRIDEQGKALSQRIDEQGKSLNQRIDNVNRRLDDQRSTMLAFFGAIITLIVALFGYIAWDRRTLMRPMQERIERLELDLARDLDLSHAEGSRLTRLLAALRELAKTDRKIAEVLRAFSLL